MSCDSLELSTEKSESRGRYQYNNLQSGEKLQGSSSSNSARLALCVNMALGPVMNSSAL